MSNWQHAGFVESDSSNRKYEIKINEKGEYGCSCPAYKFSGQRNCKHVEKFKNMVEEGSAPVTVLEVVRDGMSKAVKASKNRSTELKPCEECGGLFTHKQGCANLVR